MEFEVKAYDKNNNVITCDKCPKAAGFFSISDMESIGLCEDHSPLANQPEATFLYDPCGNKDCKVGDNISEILEHYVVYKPRKKDDHE